MGTVHIRSEIGGKGFLSSDWVQEELSNAPTGGHLEILVIYDVRR